MSWHDTHDDKGNKIDPDDTCIICLESFERHRIEPGETCNKFTLEK